MLDRGGSDLRRLSEASPIRTRLPSIDFATSTRAGSRSANAATCEIAPIIRRPPASASSDRFHKSLLSTSKVTDSLGILTFAFRQPTESQAEAWTCVLSFAYQG